MYIFIHAHFPIPVADNIQTGTHTVCNHKVIVFKGPLPLPPPPPNYGTGEEEKPRSILIEGLKLNIEKDMLELFFESKRHSGGGEIEEIKMYQKTGRAIIRFVNSAGRSK